MSSPYRLQIVYADGSKPTTFYAGGTGERDLIDAIVTKTAEKDVGMFRTKAQVLHALEAALHEVLQELKREARPVS